MISPPMSAPVRPKPAIANPQHTTATMTARPWRWTFTSQPEKTIAITAPTAGADWSSPTVFAPPAKNTPAAAGNRARGLASTMAMRSAAKLARTTRFVRR